MSSDQAKNDLWLALYHRYQRHRSCLSQVPRACMAVPRQSMLGCLGTQWAQARNHWYQLGMRSTKNQPSACQATADCTIRYISLTPLMQTSWHRQPPLVPMPSAPPDFRYTTDLSVSDALDLPLLSTRAPVVSPSRAPGSLATSCHVPTFSFIESDSDQEDVVSRHSSGPTLQVANSRPQPYSCSEPQPP